MCYEKKLSEIPIVKASGGLARLEYCAGLLVYDNSEIRASGNETNHFQYHFSGQNLGTAGAYRYALAYAHENKIEWIILLDQDTSISTSILEKYDSIIKKDIDKKTGALLPIVKEGGKKISPCIVNAIGGMNTKKLNFTDGAIISGISSGAILRVEVFRDIIEKMPERLWLDYVDHWMYLFCQRSGYCLNRIDVTLEHKLSINNPRSLSQSRIRSIFDGERLYCRELSKAAYIFWFARASFRILRYTLTDVSYLKKVLSAYAG